ncbi:site-specific DNA-methyltransferase [Pelagibacteraceae bacterium]|jgi:hypothetical protein|nr:site-specific DNA-methyltransferase [Pelagibacteraceae bacterium]
MIQSLICDFRNDLIDKIKFDNINKFVEDRLNEDGTVWILSNNQYKNKILQIKSFDICNSLSGLLLKNIILFYNNEKNRKNIFFNDSVEHILFFSKSKKFYLNKDPIREKHIWKDVEWGKRKKNYNPKGKDPGNVWIKTNDDGKGSITEHIPLNESEAIERIIKCSSEKKDTISTFNIRIKNSFDRKVNEEKF